jgi:hypothetical protein
MAFLIPKRGGSAKVVILLGRVGAAPRRALLEAVFARARAIGLRKVFAIHPATDVEHLSALRDYGFEAEGLLNDPYLPGVDEMILSRFIL